MKKSSWQPIQIPEPFLSRLFFADIRLSSIWLLVRVYIGLQWVEAGWAKVTSPLWTGSQAGTALQGFLMGSLKKTGGLHPDVSGMYASFLHTTVLPFANVWSFLIAYGELFVGVALILGLFTGIAAFFGAFMNMNYLFAGTISTNPFMFLCELFLILAWRTAGWYGFDRWLLPLLGAPWKTGKVFKR